MLRKRLSFIYQNENRAFKKQIAFFNLFNIWHILTSKIYSFLLSIGSWNKTFGANASQTHVKVYPIQERRKQSYNACGSVRGFPNLDLTTRDSLRVGPVMVLYGRKRLVIEIGKQLNVHISWKTNHNSEITQIWISFLHTYMSRNVTKGDSVLPMIKL